MLALPLWPPKMAKQRKERCPRTRCASRRLESGRPSWSSSNWLPLPLSTISTSEDWGEEQHRVWERIYQTSESRCAYLFYKETLVIRWLESRMKEITSRNFSCVEVTRRRSVLEFKECRHMSQALRAESELFFNSKTNLYLVCWVHPCSHGSARTLSWRSSRRCSLAANVQIDIDMKIRNNKKGHLNEC